MSTNLQKIGPALIDMDSVSQEFHIKGPYIAQENQYSPFITKYDLDVAGTTNAVVDNIGGVLVSRIAKTSDQIKASVPNTDETSDDKYMEQVLSVASDSSLKRSTVENANCLGNEPATAYYKTVDGQALETTVETLISRYGQELKELRAEHNHLMQQLAVKGSIDTYRPLAGYYDTFRTNYPLHQIGVMATARVDSPSNSVISVKQEEAALFTAGDWVVLRDSDDELKRYDIMSIYEDGAMGENTKGIQANGTINLTGIATFVLRANKAQMYRSLGESYQNSFVFGHFATDVASDEEVFVAGLTDDNYTVTKDIKAADTGFATTFRINAALLGADKCYLSKVKIMAKKTGSPGDLMCYIIDAKNISQFMSPEQADEESLILAKSKPLTLSSTSGLSIVEFEFDESGQYPLLDNLDMNDEKTNLCMIITTSSADNRNYYTIQFLQSRNKETNEVQDLQTNSVVYTYNKSSATLMSQDVFTSLNTDDTLTPLDLFHIVLARPSLAGKFTAFANGLYSAHFETYEPVKLQDARLTLRVAREGIYNVTRTSGGNTNDVPNGGSIVYEENVTYRNADERMDNIDGFSSAVGKDIIIGTHIARVQSVNEKHITIANGAHIEPGAPVYPMGYKAYLVCNTRYWDTESQTQKFGTPVRIPLKFTQVQPAYFEAEIDVRENMLAAETTSEYTKYRLMDKNRVSDYLIFEGNSNSTREFNTFDLQIRWDRTSNAYQQNVTFAGRIYELSVALNRSF